MALSPPSELRVPPTATSSPPQPRTVDAGESGRPTRAQVPRSPSLGRPCAGHGSRQRKDVAGRRPRQNGVATMQPAFVACVLHRSRAQLAPVPHRRHTVERKRAVRIRHFENSFGLTLVAMSRPHHAWLRTAVPRGKIKNMLNEGMRSATPELPHDRRGFACPSSASKRNNSVRLALKSQTALATRS